MAEIALAAPGQCDGVVADAPQDASGHRLEIKLQERAVVTRRQRPVRLSDVVVLVLRDVDVVEAGGAGGGQALTEAIPVILDRHSLAIDRDHATGDATLRRG